MRKPEPQDRPRLPSVAGFSFVPFVIFCSKKSTKGQAFIAGQQLMAQRRILRLPACTARKPAKAHEYWLRSRFLEPKCTPRM